MTMALALKPLKKSVGSLPSASLPIWKRVPTNPVRSKKKGSDRTPAKIRPSPLRAAVPLPAVDPEPRDAADVERHRVGAGIAGHRVVLVAGGTVVETHDVGQILHGITVAVDVQDVAHIGAELATEGIDGGIGGHHQDGAAGVPALEGVDVVDVALAVHGDRVEGSARGPEAAEGRGVDVVCRARQERCRADGQHDERCPERGDFEWPFHGRSFLDPGG